MKGKAKPIIACPDITRQKRRKERNIAGLDF
jgi:hypothetical protein